MREGLPQGLGISPLLATLAIEMFEPPKGLIMYADDGIFVGTKEKEIQEWISKLGLAGIRLEPKKSGWKEEFDFLGAKIDVRGSITIDGYKTGYRNPEVNQLLKTMKSPYAKIVPEKWNWNICHRSYLQLFGTTEGLGIWSILKIIVWSWWKGESYKGYRNFFGVGIRDVNGGSTICIKALLERLKELNLHRIQEMRKIGVNKKCSGMVTKGWKGTRYLEIIYENALRKNSNQVTPDEGFLGDALNFLDGFDTQDPLFIDGKGDLLYNRLHWEDEYEDEAYRDRVARKHYWKMKKAKELRSNLSELSQWVEIPKDLQEKLFPVDKKKK